MTSTPPDETEPAFATRQVHAGQSVEGAHGARITPIYLSAGFAFDDFDEAADRFNGGEGYSYTRLGNPTTTAVERKLAALEGGVEAIATSSGQAAVSLALLGLLKAGDHFLSSRSIYEGSRGLFRDVFPRFGIEVDFVDDQNDPQAWRRLSKPTTRAYFAETIANPRNEILDIEAIADAAHEQGVPLVIDSTFTTPYLARPIEHGADIVVHSTSKFLAGHGSSLGGVIVDGGRFPWADFADGFPHLATPTASGEASFVDRFGSRAYAVFTRDVLASRLGPTPSPFNTFLLQQGIETLSLRLDRHSSNALALATWLESRPEVASVDYSGLESSPYAELSRRYLPRGAGSVFSFTLHGGEQAARIVHDNVALFTRMTHLGDVRSLVLHPGTTSHAHATPAELAAAGIDPGLLRISVGVEDPRDLIADLTQALEKLPAGEPADHHPRGNHTARDHSTHRAAVTQV
ncbi:O-acetylhomoserine aminocarboxypropyltransferase/cysteine synthase family protein [Herbiconiux sp. L3-i23]|uniref:O-acetylhomoserine aminocarboxypropyltransferase/cysteine synthase family protein n=1 Tax=Herbiconiux sp. L3-i23 TaxID=2905871 RepID=UPI002067976A|nr:aminotransferase class I/II-fold pyridoxal phosphate-dependent enzyme [Herbiconiux sp. L3-i23]BDI23399.1 bifunctional o-acetylhomoserine/o-acetylserine sulfhydrylase [Herbiconiux sp. L3-i23]